MIRKSKLQLNQSTRTFMPTVPVILLVHGEAAVGKTTLARRLAPDLKFPCFGKDDISELLFDKIGIQYNAPSISSKNGIFSTIALRTLSIIAEEFIDSRQSVILDAPFHSDILRPVLEMEEQTPDIKIVQIFCVADQATRQSRYEYRIKTGSRHPGHGDRLSHQIEQPSHPMLDMQTTITLDLTHFGDTDYKAFLDKLTKTIGCNYAQSN